MLNAYSSLGVSLNQWKGAWKLSEEEKEGGACEN